jgi:ribonuclease M5
MIKIKQAVVVEGKYDAINLSNIIDTLFIETNGFGIFKDKDKIKYLKKIADERGLVIITDSDSAGQMIRNYLCSFIPEDKIYNVYLQPIIGKERRKKSQSKEGLIGAEGYKADVIIDALKNSGIFESSCCISKHYSIADLYNWGLTGKLNSVSLRNAFLVKLNLPHTLSTNALLKYLNTSSIDDKVIKGLINDLKKDENN